jgi:hypothetical protein
MFKVYDDTQIALTYTSVFALVAMFVFEIGYTDKELLFFSQLAFMSMIMVTMGRFIHRVQKARSIEEARQRHLKELRNDVGEDI